MVNSFSKGHSFCCFKSFLNISRQGSKGYQFGGSRKKNKNMSS